MNSDDDNLVLRAKEGDEEAFCRLDKRHRAKLTAYCKTFVHDEADDVTQDAFVRAHLRISTLNGETEAAFKAWLYQIARNLCIDVLKKRSREAEANDTLLGNQSNAPSLEDTIISKCFVEEAYEKVCDLLEEEIDRFICFYYYGLHMSSEEVASKLPDESEEWRLTASGVRARLKRFVRPAIKKIFEHFKDGEIVAATDDIINPVHNKIASLGKRNRDGGLK